MPATPPLKAPLVDKSTPYTPYMAFEADVLLCFVCPLTPRPCKLMPAMPAPTPLFVPLMHGDDKSHVSIVVMFEEIRPAVISTSEPKRITRVSMIANLRLLDDCRTEGYLQLEAITCLLHTRDSRT